MAALTRLAFGQVHSWAQCDIKKAWYVGLKREELTEYTLISHSDDIVIWNKWELSFHSGLSSPMLPELKFLLSGEENDSLPSSLWLSE